MAQLKIVSFAIANDGNLTVDIGPGTHGADCADIIEGFGAAVGSIEKDVWRPEENCAGNCGKCESAYHARQRELRAHAG